MSEKIKTHYKHKLFFMINLIIVTVYIAKNERRSSTHQANSRMSIDFSIIS